MIVDCMDCHAAHAARNDRESGFFKQDSRACGGAVDFHRLQRILGFAMRKQAKRCKAQPQQVSLVNLCFASKHKGVTLGGNDRRVCEAIKDLSRKAESTSEKTMSKENK